MKKILSFLLALSMALCLAACGDKAPAGDHTQDDPPLREDIIYEKGGLTITAVEPYSQMVGVNNSVCWFIDYRLENKSQEDIFVFSSGMCVNGVHAGSGITASLAPDSSTVQTVRIYQFELDRYGITEIGEISSYFTVTFKGSTTLSDTALPITQTYAAYPPVQVSGISFYDDGSVKLEAFDIYTDDNGDFVFYFYARNNGSQSVTVDMENIVINGTALPESRAHAVASVYPGTLNCSLLLVDKSALDFFHLASVDSLSFTIAVTEDVGADPRVSEVLTCSIPAMVSQLRGGA